MFRWQTILTRVLPPSQKTIHSFKLVVGHMTKHMKHGRPARVRHFQLRVIIFQCLLTTVHHLYTVSIITQKILGTMFWVLWADLSVGPDAYSSSSGAMILLEIESAPLSEEDE